MGCRIPTIGGCPITKPPPLLTELYIKWLSNKYITYVFFRLAVFLICCEGIEGGTLMHSWSLADGDVNLLDIVQTHYNAISNIPWRRYQLAVSYHLA